MSFIKAALAKLFPTGSPDTTPATDHYQSLEQLRAAHEWIDVKIIRTERRYQSLILTIDIENSELVIDELYPPEQLDSIVAGERVEIASQSRSKPVSFYTRILARPSKAGDNAWRVELPSEIGRNLNRSAFRLYVENEQDLNIEIYTEDGEPLPLVRIINISAEGIKLGFANDSEPQLNRQSFYKHCLIRLPNGVDIDCSIELKSVYSIHTPKPHILGGGKLLIDNPQQLVKLQQYLAAVQRRQRRGETHTV